MHAAILVGAKLIGPRDGLQVDKPKVGKVTGSVDSPKYRSVRDRLVL